MKTYSNGFLYEDVDRIYDDNGNEIETRVYNGAHFESTGERVLQNLITREFDDTGILRKEVDEQKYVSSDIENLHTNVKEWDENGNFVMNKDITKNQQGILCGIEEWDEKHNVRFTHHSYKNGAPKSSYVFDPKTNTETYFEYDRGKIIESKTREVVDLNKEDLIAKRAKSISDGKQVSEKSRMVSEVFGSLGEDGHSGSDGDLFGF